MELEANGDECNNAEATRQPDPVNHQRRGRTSVRSRLIRASKCSRMQPMNSRPLVQRDRTRREDRHLRTSMRYGITSRCGVTRTSQMAHLPTKRLSPLVDSLPHAHRLLQ